MCREVPLRAVEGGGEGWVAVGYGEAAGAANATDVGRHGGDEVVVVEVRGRRRKGHDLTYMRGTAAVAASGGEAVVRGAGASVGGAGGAVAGGGCAAMVGVGQWWRDKLR